MGETMIPHCSFRWVKRSEPVRGRKNVAMEIKVLQQLFTTGRGPKWIDVPTVEDE